jgi:sulfide:quinone oxidoreductase
VKNILDEMAGRAPGHDFKSELVCIVDTIDRGILVYRSEKFSVFLPEMKAMHWAKRLFERHYLRAYRR